MAENVFAAQALLIPEIVSLVGRGDCRALLAHATRFSQYGLRLEAFGPALLLCAKDACDPWPTVNAEAMLRDILDELPRLGQSGQSAKRRWKAMLFGAWLAIGRSGSGRRCRQDEMNALLRRDGATPHSGQCNHGRPTYVSLKLLIFERLSAHMDPDGSGLLTLDDPSVCGDRGARWRSSAILIPADRPLRGLSKTARMTEPISST